MVNTSGLAGELIDEESPRPFFLPDTINDLYPGTNGDANLIDGNVFEKFIGPGSVQVHPDFDRIKWVNEAYYRSLQLLRQFRSVFNELVAALLEKKQLTAEELNPILSKLPRKSPRSKLYTWSTTRKAVEALEATNPNDPRLAVYHATKRAMDISTATWKAQQARDAAKKAHHEAEVNSKRAHQEIVYMLRNNKSLVEAKQHFLGILKDMLEVQQGMLRYQRQLPWGQRNYQITQALRNRINVMKEEISTCKTELKQVKATVAA